MERCPYFREHKTHHPSQEKGQGRRSSEVNTTRRMWCAHEESPLDEKASNAIGSNSRLACKGDLKNCPIIDKI
jgi:hypothetical protein